jgi:hypothetical protein
VELTPEEAAEAIERYDTRVAACRRIFSKKFSTRGVSVSVASAVQNVDFE